MQEQLLPDYELANWYVSTHPESRFVKNLTVAMPANGRRYALFNTEFSVHHLDGPSEHRKLAGATEIRQVLEEELAVPDEPVVRDQDALGRHRAGVSGAGLQQARELSDGGPRAWTNVEETARFHLAVDLANRVVMDPQRST